MKLNKVLMLSSIIALSLASVSQAQYNNTTKGSLSTIAAAKKMRDDYGVKLQGKVIQQLGDDDFLFQDASGQTIEIELEKSAMYGLPAFTQKNLVEIHGNVDKEAFEKTKIEVYKLVVVK